MSICAPAADGALAPRPSRKTRPRGRRVPRMPKRPAWATERAQPATPRAAGCVRLPAASRRRIIRAAAAGLALLLAGPAAAQQQIPDLVATDALRVCADPANMPFSSHDKSGFENKIADLVGAELKLPVRYYWLPQYGYVAQHAVDRVVRRHHRLCLRGRHRPAHQSLLPLDLCAGGARRAAARWHHDPRGSAVEGAQARGHRGNAAGRPSPEARAHRGRQDLLPARRSPLRLAGRGGARRSRRRDHRRRPALGPGWRLLCRQGVRASHRRAADERSRTGRG